MINDAVVRCNIASLCKKVEEKTQELIGRDTNVQELKQKLKFYALDPAIDELKYKVVKTNEKTIVVFDITFKYRISRIRYKSNYDIDFKALERFLPYAKGDYFNPKKNEEIYQIMTSYLAEKGYNDSQVTLRIELQKDKVSLLFDVDVGSTSIVDQIEVFGDNDEMQQQILLRLLRFKENVWDKVQLKVEIDDIEKELFDQGYFSSKVIMREAEKIPNTNRVIIKIQVSRGEKINFSVSGNTVFSRADILTKVKESVKNSLGILNSKQIEEAIRELYEKRGHFETTIAIRKASGKTYQGSPFINYYIDIHEKEKLKVLTVSYGGNSYFSLSQIEDFYYENASVLASRGFMDKEYLDNFTEILKKEYLKKGFVFADVSKPKITYDKSKNISFVKYRIKERQQAILEEISIRNISPELKSEIIDKLANKKGKPINLIAMQSDLVKVVDTARSKGYYYATIKNLNAKNLITYANNYTQAYLNIEVVPERLTVLNEVLVTGNTKTRSEVILREVETKKNEKLTPEIVDELKARLVGLGPYSFVRISPVVVNRNENSELYITNLIIQVKEKDQGYIEVAPGYRTDLGVKVSSIINYNSPWSMNRDVSLKLQGNQRLDYANLHPDRKAQEKRLFEYLTKFNFKEPYLAPKILGKRFEFNNSISYQQKRYYAFDARIVRISPSVSKSFTKHISAGLRYQWESIDQFNGAVDDSIDEIDKKKNNENFKIGSLTPFVNYDKRDNPITARNGYFLSLSWEFANKYFGSLDDENLKVNYYKVITRNKFYYSLSPKWTIASSIASGVERNLAKNVKENVNGADVYTNGFIPGTKVFRLDGVDNVRGFSDREINKLSSGFDISDTVIRDKAYFINFKFEPRYFMSDTSVLGVFFDAGRVYKDHFQPMKLRTAAGLSFKFLTPVGTLDFDYGVKLKREGTKHVDREKFGRFHLSIGYF